MSALMDPNQVKSRPPYIQFKEEFVEDRTVTLESGKYGLKPANLVIIRQAGSKDSVEKLAEDWLESLPRNPGYPPEWVRMFKDAYAQWQADRSLDTPVQGTHVRLWPAIGKQQVELLLSGGCRTVEDLAAANEQLLARIGMGARELQQRARAWLDAAKDTGKIAEEVIALRVTKEQQDQQIAELTKRVAELAALVPARKLKQVESEDFS